MTMNFVSSKAKIKGYLEGNNVILGPAVIGEGSLIGRNVIVGYPARKSIEAFHFAEPFDIGKYDSISRGAKVGRDCVIRSGTVIYETATISDGVETGHNVLIRESSTIGERSRIGSSTQLDGTVIIGRNVNIQSNVYLPHLTIVEDGAFIAPYVCFTNDPYPPSKRLAGVTVEKNAIIGANTCIVAGVRIGENSVAGAGSIVTKDVPANIVVVGVPARYHATRREYEEKKRTWDEAR